MAILQRAIELEEAIVVKSRMNISLCLSSSEITFPFFEGLRRKNTKSKTLARVGHVSNGDNSQVQTGDAGKLLTSAHLMSRHLEESFIGKKRLQATQKLDLVRTLLIDNYDSYTYNIYQELAVINGLPPVVICNDDWTWKDVCHYLYEENAFDNIVISPGPGSPTCPADIGICLQLLLECKDIPILGVCLGHQALGYVHGAQVVHASEPIHGRLSEVEHNGCRLFYDIPSGRNSGFKVVRYHSLIIDEESLPKELIPIAWTSSTDTLSFLEKSKSDAIANAFESDIKRKIYADSFSYESGIRRRKVLMGIMHSTRPHYGLQFHPESVATCHGRQIFKNFREITVDYWKRKRSSFIDERNGHYTGPPFKSIIKRSFQN